MGMWGLVYCDLYKQLRIALEHVYCCCIGVRQTVMGYTRTIVVLSAEAVMQGCEISDWMKPGADKCIQMSAICMHKYIQLLMHKLSIHKWPWFGYTKIKLWIQKLSMHKWLQSRYTNIQLWIHKLSVYELQRFGYTKIKLWIYKWPRFGSWLSGSNSLARYKSELYTNGAQTIFRFQ